MTSLPRKAPIKVTNPDQLDRTLSVMRPYHLFGVLFVLGVVLGGIVWSVVATAPVKVHAPAVLLYDGVSTVTSQGTGRLERWLVAVGDTVTPASGVALLDNPQLLEEVKRAQAAVATAKENYAVFIEEFNAQKAANKDLLTLNQKTADERREKLESLLALLRKRYEGEQRLSEKGLVTSDQLIETETQIAEVSNQLSAVQSSVALLRVSQQRDLDNRNDQVEQQKARVRALEREAKDKQSDYERQRTVVAGAAGIIATLNADLNDQIKPGQQLANLITGNDRHTPLTVFAYVAPNDGQRVKPKMTVQIAPSTIRPELDGFLKGQVESVSPLPQTRASLLGTLGNELLVEQMSRNGPPWEVRIALIPDPATKSGFAWTSGDGPDVVLNPGTMADTAIVVERTHLISLIFPAVDYIYGWLGVR